MPKDYLGRVRDVLASKVREKRDTEKQEEMLGWYSELADKVVEGFAEALEKTKINSARSVLAIGDDFVVLENVTHFQLLNGRFKVHLTSGQIVDFDMTSSQLKDLFDDMGWDVIA